MRLLGCPSIAALDSSYVDAPAHWFTHVTGAYRR
jgi:hypothetical protein